MTAYADASRVLAAAAAGLDAAGRRVPGRVVVAPGADPAWDCEQLTVQVVRTSVQGPAGSETVSAWPVSVPRFVELRVELVRAVPVAGSNGAPPSTAAWSGAAESLLDDADALRAALTPVALVGDDRSGRSVYIGPYSLNGPAGGLASVSVVVQIPA